MSKKSKSSTQSKTVTTPTNPAFVTSGIEHAMNRVKSIGEMDPQSLIADVNPLQQLAAERIGKVGEQRNFMEGLGSAPNVSAASVLDGLDRYMSPYTRDVVDASMADFDADRDATLSQLALDMAGSQKFGGSGGALAVSETRDALGRGRATLGATLRDQGFTRGAELANQDAARRQSASETNARLAAEMAGLRAQMGLAAEQSDRANIGQMFDLGTALREIEAQRRTAPISLATTEAGLLAGLPLGLLHGQIQEGNSTTTSKTSDPMGALGSLAMLAAAPLTGGTSLLGMGLSGLGALGSGAGLASSAAGLAGRSALGGLAGDMFFGRG